MKDSLYSFFEKEKTYDYTSAFGADLYSNSYSFSNIGNLINLMYLNKFVGELADPEWLQKHPNWNKALLVPVEITSIKYTSSTYYGTSTSETPISTENKLGLTSTRLVRGTADKPIQIQVIYGKFKD